MFSSEQWCFTYSPIDTLTNTGVQVWKEKIMKSQMIPKQAYIPPFDSQAIKVQHIEYFDPLYQEYHGEKITEQVIAIPWKQEELEKIRQ